jgi:hypothetical protein
VPRPIHREGRRTTNRMLRLGIRGGTDRAAEVSAFRYLFSVILVCVGKLVYILLKVITITSQVRYIYRACSACCTQRPGRRPELTSKFEGAGIFTDDDSTRSYTNTLRRNRERPGSFLVSKVDACDRMTCPDNISHECPDSNVSLREGFGGLKI